LQLFPITRAEAKETEGGIVRGIRAGKEVVGELLDDEPVVGQVAVEGGDDPVAIEPGRTLRVAPRFGDIGVACEVEPMTRPAFAVVGGSEEFGNQ
jgi:hypothetical protein